MEFPFHDATLCNLKYWNGDNHNLTDDRARWTEIQQFEIKFFSDTHWYRTYLIWLLYDRNTAVKIGTVDIIKYDTDDEEYLFHSRFPSPNTRKHEIWQGPLADLERNQKPIMENLIAYYDQSRKGIAKAQKMETKRRVALAMASYPRLGADAPIKVLDDPLVSEILKYCDRRT